MEAYIVQLETCIAKWEACIVKLEACTVKWEECIIHLEACIVIRDMSCKLGSMHCKLEMCLVKLEVCIASRSSLIAWNGCDRLQSLLNFLKSVAWPDQEIFSNECVWPDDESSGKKEFFLILTDTESKVALITLSFVRLKQSTMENSKFVSSVCYMQITLACFWLLLLLLTFTTTTLPSMAVWSFTDRPTMDGHSIYDECGSERVKTISVDTLA